MRTLLPFPTSSLLQDYHSFFDRTRSAETPHQLFATDEGWVLRIDLPGFAKSEIALNFEDKALVLHAKQEETTERLRESISQRYALGEEVDTTQIAASLEHGVLEIKLPKHAEPADKSTQIEIQ